MSDSSECCLACGLQGSTNFHFGGSSCTACASFFRRTVSLNIQYVCNRENECIKSPELRIICRACRYDCCVKKAGFQRDLVQPRRNLNRIPKYVLERQVNGEHQPVIVRDYTTNSYRTIHELSQNFCDDQDYSKLLNISHQHLMDFYVKQVQSAMSLKIKNTMTITSMRELVEVITVHNNIAWEMCKSCPGVDLLEREDLAVLFKYCAFVNTWVDSAWMYSQSEKDNWEEDINQCDELSGTIFEAKSTICSSLAQLKLSLVEFGALRSFCIWKLGVLDFTLPLKIVAQEQYLGVTSAMRKYYEQSTRLKPFEIAARIAEITLQIAPMFETYKKVTSLYKKFGMHALDDRTFV